MNTPIPMLHRQPPTRLPIAAGLPSHQHAPVRRVGIGEVAVSARPATLHTLLGSCVSVCLYDPAKTIGGMNHILLPGVSADQKTRFGVHAMELLINQMMLQGADRRRLVAKAFGGANVIPVLSPPTVGELNAAFVRTFLAAERIPLVAQRLGGEQALSVRFSTDTGKAVAGAANGSRISALIRTEQTYSAPHHADASFSGETTLF